MERFFDIIIMSFVLIALYYQSRNKLWWLVYSLGCLLCVFLMIYKNLYGLSIMNIAAIFIGIKNYLRK